ncbi:MAG: SDR family NAD(P)-dependent oxidoreductase [Desulfuromonadales bacterium]|nr:SDR family NAD(P)-dependent oxidoreductase [Desulfuromonadales bacterium]MBN2791878.1 SDR family NAD(P)-dependent oxidoreductase [Desulfuromonadales bacterium]
MGNDLTGKKALVTGASRGIGRAVALKLASLGAAVAVNYLNAEEQAQAVVNEIISNGGRAITIQADMSRTGAVEQMFQTVLAEYGKLDILVNNAGMAIFGPLEEISEADFDRLMALNVKGVFFACQQAAKHLADGGADHQYFDGRDQDDVAELLIIRGEQGCG